MAVTIEEQQSPPLKAHEKRVLRAMFDDYSRLVVRSRLKGGLSGSSVYLVRPIWDDGPELPAVVKIDLYERIEQEWQAYSSYIQRRLPSVAEIHAQPVNPQGSQYSGLWYPLAGAGIDKITSLQQFFQERSPEEVVELLEKQLFPRFSTLWLQAGIYPAFHFRAAYDDFLPLNLKVECTEPIGKPIWLHPESIHEKEWENGDYVQITGFKVMKLLRKKQGLSLDTPETHKAFRLHVYGVEDVSQYEIGQVIQRPFIGLVTDTRQRQLFQQAQNAVGPGMDLKSEKLTLPDGRQLPNPLTKWREVLQNSMDVRVASIHGDLNMENVLVNWDLNTVHLIDFAKSRRDHVLRDLLHLEMAVVNKVLVGMIADGEETTTVVHQLFQYLHCSVAKGVHVVPPPGQEKVFTILQSIRKAAQSHILQTNGWKEYYTGLFIYLLGSLRYGDLDDLPTAPRPKQLAFWSAATILDLLENEPDCVDFEVKSTPATSKSINIQSKTEVVEEPVSDWDIDKIVANWQTSPLSQRLKLFNILKEHFHMKDLEELAYSVGLQIDDLPSSGKSGKAQELIGYFERRGRIRELLKATAEARPKISWD